MSIYIVRLNEWFPIGDENYENSKMMVKYSNCLKCGKDGKKVNYKYVYSHHSLPWDNGDMICSKKCLNKTVTKVGY